MKTLPARSTVIQPIPVAFGRLGTNEPTTFPLESYFSTMFRLSSATYTTPFESTAMLIGSLN
jgi:hypothetical protein